MLRERAALAPELDDRHRILVLAGGAVILLDLPFDREAVAVPAGHVVGIEPEHLLAARHHVLEDLVKRMPDMDRSVGIGRTVMQDEFRPPLGRLAQARVEAEVAPSRQQLGLPLR